MEKNNKQQSDKHLHRHIKTDTSKLKNFHLTSTKHINEQIEMNHIIQKCPPHMFLYNILEEKQHLKIINKSNKNLRYDLTKFEDMLFVDHKSGREIKLGEHFHIQAILGKGSFGLVLQVYDMQLETKAALKIIKKAKFTMHKNEAQHLKELRLINHPNMVRFYRAFEDDVHLFIVMELMEGGSLKDLIIERYNKKGDFFNELECAQIIRSITDGIDKMHFMKMIHRDLKPGNILL